METCPFCDKPVSDRATVCSGCHAEKGYGSGANGVYGRGRAIVGLMMLVAVSVAAFVLGPIIAASAGDEKVYYYWMAAGVGVLFLLLAVRWGRLIRKGPRWFR